MHDPLSILNSSIVSTGVACDFGDGMTIRAAGRGFIKLTGYTLDELLNTDYESLVVGDVRKIKGEIQRQFEENGNYLVEYKIRLKNGNIIWVIDNGILVDEGGKISVQGFLTDVTKQKNTEEALRVSQKRYEIAMGFSNVTIFDYDVRTKMIITEPADFTLYGMPGIMHGGIEEVIKLGIISKRSHEAVRQLYREIDEGAQSSRAIVYANTVSGVENILELQLINIFDDEGAPMRAIGVRKDITQQLMLEKEREYGRILSTGRMFAYEANITLDKIIRYDSSWAKGNSVDDIKTFSGLVNRMCKKNIMAEDGETLKRKLSKGALISAFEGGQNSLTMEYRQNGSAADHSWYEKTLYFIKEPLSGDIIVRCYIANIGEKKEKEQAALAAQLHYKAMLAKCAIVYEVNITTDAFISGHEKLGETFGVKQSDTYSLMMAELCQSMVYPADREAFCTVFRRQNVMSCYRGGKREIICEYRRPNSDGIFTWVRCAMQLFADPVTDDVRGFIFVENINEEKQKEMELVYKSQHDLLTGLYNKATAEERINNFFVTGNAKAAKHVFFMVDLDYFKAINDNLGHAFGDVVLSQAASKLKMLFRDEDILGRIGGDEFVVLMKNVQDERMFALKAREICDCIRDVFTQNGANYTLSASIGIAFYGKNGKTYGELYHCADIALYEAKARGRNGFAIYSGDMRTCITTVNDIDHDRVIEIKKFEENIGEYMFRILYSAPDKAAAINSVLQLIGNHYNLSRAYIFEDSIDAQRFSATFEWCNNGVPSCRKAVKDVSYDDIPGFRDRFDANGIFYVSDVECVTGYVHDWMAEGNVKSMLNFSITHGNKNIGFVGFDQCGYLRHPSKGELSDYRSVCDFLGVFISEMRSVLRLGEAKNMALSIVNGLDSYAYVCDPQTYEVLFANERLLGRVPSIRVGKKCYETIWGYAAPCADCPMQALVKSKKPIFTMDVHSEALNMWARVTTIWIDWNSEKRVCLLDSVDISKYKIK